MNAASGSLCRQTDANSSGATTVLVSIDQRCVVWSELRDTTVRLSDSNHCLIVDMPADQPIVINGIRFNLRTLLRGVCMREKE